MSDEKDKPEERLPWWEEWELNDGQRRFVEEYCVDFNASRAARDAGYSEKTAGQIGFELLRNPKISGAIDEYLDAMSMTKGEATRRLTDWGRGNLGLFLVKEGDHFVIDLGSPQAQENMHLLKKAKQEVKRLHGPEGQIVEVKTEIELHDAKDAVDKIAKARGLYTDKVELSGPGGGPIRTDSTVSINREPLTAAEVLEIAQLLKELGGLEPDQYDNGSEAEEG